MKAALLALTLLVAAVPGAVAREAPRPPAATLAAERIGAGTLRWFGLQVYDAALWAPRRPFDAAASFVLVLRYARALEGGRIATRSIDEIARLEASSEAQRQDWGEALRALLPDVAPGDLLAGEHRPGRGVRFWLNGRPIGEIADPAFARAFFAIWLDARSSAPALRAALLGVAP
ncbi:MAG TPA: chalcone isomerase family protein [Burkholderiales bacterium]